MRHGSNEWKLGLSEIKDTIENVSDQADLEHELNLEEKDFAADKRLKSSEE